MTAKKYFEREIKRMEISLSHIEQNKNYPEDAKKRLLQKKRWFCEAVDALSARHGSMLAMARKDFENE